MKAIIVDDEVRARVLLSQMLDTFCPNVEVIDTCEDLVSGVKSIYKNQPNLVFLDIEMPRNNGLEILDFFKDDEVNFNIIFTTAYDKYAVDAFKMSALDYLLKPIDPEELERAVEKCGKKISLEAGLSVLRKNLGHLPSKRIAVPLGNGFRFVEHEDIQYLKADNSYTEIHLSDGSKLVVSRTLKKFEDVLMVNTDFFRTHKSYIVNLLHVAEYVKSDGGYLLMRNKETVSLSPDKAQDFLARSQAVKR